MEPATSLDLLDARTVAAQLLITVARLRTMAERREYPELLHVTRGEYRVRRADHEAWAAGRWTSAERAHTELVHARAKQAVLLPANPVDGVDWPRPADTPPHGLTELELAGILARITDPWAAHVGVAMAYTGMRRAEFARLRREDIDLANHVLWVRGKARAQSHVLLDQVHVALSGRVGVLAATAKLRLVPKGDRGAEQTPPEFRDVLLGIAASARAAAEAQS